MNVEEKKKLNEVFEIFILVENLFLRLSTLRRRLYDSWLIETCAASGTCYL